jgi:hypothetical protein
MFIISQPEPRSTVRLSDAAQAASKLIQPCSPLGRTPFILFHIFLLANIFHIQKNLYLQ